MVVPVADFLTATGTHEKGTGGDGENGGGSGSQCVSETSLALSGLGTSLTELLPLSQRSTSTLLRPRDRRFLLQMSSKRDLLREHLPQALHRAPNLM